MKRFTTWAVALFCLFTHLCSAQTSEPSQQLQGKVYVIQNTALRESKDPASKVIRKLLTGDKVVITNNTDPSAYIAEIDGVSGYVERKHLSLTKPEIPATRYVAIPKDSMAWRYIDVGSPLGGFTSKAIATIVTGDKSQGWFKRIDLLTDDQGKEIKFNNHVDCLNFLSLKGWEMLYPYIETSSTMGVSTQTLHFVMKRLEKVSESGE